MTATTVAASPGESNEQGPFATGPPQHEVLFLGGAAEVEEKRDIEASAGAVDN
jgi:hypothetical protein